MVEGVATETQTPADIPGTVSLTALSASAGGRVVVDVRPGWQEPVNLYAAAVAEPGTRKSAVYRALTAPLYAAERVLDESLSQRRYEARVMRERMEELDRQARQAAVKSGEAAELKAAAEAARELDEFPVPETLQLITGDISPEECATILAAQGGRLAIMSAEGRIYDIITGRYSGGEPCLSPFLEGHAGDVLRVNRRGRYEVIERPALTIGVCIQPAVLTWIAAKPRLRGQGMLARFLYSVPADLVGTGRASRRRSHRQSETAMPARCGRWCCRWLNGMSRRILTLTTTARKAVVEYLAAVELRLRPDGDLHGIRDWAAKLAGAVVRVAGLLHVAEHLSDGYARPVSEETMMRAVRIGDYYAAHARRAFGVMAADPNLGLAQDAFGWLYPDGGPRVPFNQRDAHRRFQEREGRATTAEEIGAALRLLEIHGYIRPLPPPPASPRGGRPASPSYEVCPTPPDIADRTQKGGRDLR